MKSEMYRAADAAGRPKNPRDGVVPIMKKIDKDRLAVVGTGFYISRYGLFLTANHVIETMIDRTKRKLGVGYIVHHGENDTVHLRRILRAGLLQPADLAVGQADNYLSKYPDNPLINMRAILSTTIPEPGSSVVTYAYPENEVLDFTNEDKTPIIASDYYEGKFLRYVVKSQNPLMPYPHFETTIGLKGGASGGPVFNSKGRVIGVNCCGWDLGAEHEGDNLSSIVPIVELLKLRVELLQLPPTSWERAQIPATSEDMTFTVAELARFGHIQFEPQVI